MANALAFKSYRRNKYGNKRTKVDGMVFQSAAEARRYSELKLMERAGAIRDLRLQTSWPLKIGETLICRYRCDFEYWSSDGRQIVEDVKGVLTPAYRIKKKLMAAIHGVEIQEIMSCAT